jgi:hypothetical protein
MNLRVRATYKSVMSHEPCFFYVFARNWALLYCGPRFKNRDVKTEVVIGRSGETVMARSVSGSEFFSPLKNSSDVHEIPDSSSLSWTRQYE